MPIRIFTIPFQDDTLTFHDDVVQQFCVNKRVYKIESKFFVRDHLPFWTVAVQYGSILSEEKPTEAGKSENVEQQLDEQQKVLLLRLKEWRREKGAEIGQPVFLIATNRQLVEMILNKCTSLESLKLIKGFGKSRIQKHGKGIATLIQTFYQAT